MDRGDLLGGEPEVPGHQQRAGSDHQTEHAVDRTGRPRFGQPAPQHQGHGGEDAEPGLSDQVELQGSGGDPEDDTEDRKQREEGLRAFFGRGLAVEVGQRGEHGKQGQGAPGKQTEPQHPEGGLEASARGPEDGRPAQQPGELSRAIGGEQRRQQEPGAAERDRPGQDTAGPPLHLEPAEQPGGGEGEAGGHDTDEDATRARRQDQPRQGQPGSQGPPARLPLDGEASQPAQHERRGEQQRHIGGELPRLQDEEGSRRQHQGRGDPGPTAVERRARPGEDEEGRHGQHGAGEARGALVKTQEPHARGREPHLRPGRPGRSPGHQPRQRRRLIGDLPLPGLPEPEPAEARQEQPQSQRRQRHPRPDPAQTVERRPGAHEGCPSTPSNAWRTSSLTSSLTSGRGPASWTP